jgi:hypothetical protein
MNLIGGVRVHEPAIGDEEMDRISQLQVYAKEKELRNAGQRIGPPL